MELRQLRHFVAVAEEGNISRAARKVFLTQPALSRQIRSLEEEIGHCLLERQAHSIRLTRVGEVLLHEARELLRHAEQALERARTADQGDRLRVGYAPSLAAGLLATAVSSFTQTHPEARVEWFDSSTQEMLAGLENGSLDVILGVGPTATGKSRGPEWVPLVRAPWRLAVHRRHPLARRPRVGAADLGRESLLVFSRRDYPEYWELLSAWLRRHRQPPRFAAEYDGIESLMSAVEAGQGVALVADRQGRRVPEHVRLKALVDPPEPLCVAAGHLAGRARDPVLAVFLEELRRAARSMP